MDAALDALVGLAAAVPAQEFELQVVERIEVGQAVADGAGERRIVGEEGFTGVYFCGNCGSSLYAESGEKYYVCAGVLQNVKLEPTYHMMVAYKAPWDEISGTAPQFPEWPPDD